MKFSKLRYPNRRARRWAMHTSTVARSIRHYYAPKINKMVRDVATEMMAIKWVHK